MPDQKQKFDPDRFAGLIENPSDFRKGSGDYGVTFSVALKNVDQIKPLMTKAQRPAAVFVIETQTIEDAERLVRQDLDPDPKHQLLPGVGLNHGEKAGPRCIVSVEEIATACEMTPRNAQIQADQGIFIRKAPGQYDTLATVGRLWRAIKEAQSGQNDVFHDERTRAMRLKRQERELDYLERAGTLVPAEAVIRAIEKAKAAEKQQLLFMPKQLAPLLEGDPAVNEAALEDWVHQFLKAQTEIKITPDAAAAPGPDIDKPVQVSKRKKKKRR